MNGFAILLIWSIAISLGAAASQAPTFKASQLEYDETLKKLKDHVKFVKALPGVRKGSTPIFRIHPPGTEVYGTVLIFHGFSQNAGWSAAQAEFLFSEKFNVLALNLASYAQGPTHWIRTVVRDAAMSTRIQHILLKDSVIGPVISKFEVNQDPGEQAAFARSLPQLLIPRVLNILRKKLPYKDYLHAERVVRFLSPGLVAPHMEKEYRKIFRSGHQRFESDPLSKLQLVQALPGPMHVIGYSFGTAAAVNLAALSKTVSKAVILAPYFGGYTDWKERDVNHFRTLLGTVELTKFKLGPISVPGSVLATLIPTSNLLNRDVILHPMRENTRTLCVVAEDDGSVDVPNSLEVCRSKLGGETYVYPRRLGVGHFVTPEVGSKYSNALLKQISRFLKKGSVEKSGFLIPN